MWKGRRKERGFTMLEVIATLAVIGVTVPAIFGMLHSTQKAMNKGAVVADIGDALQAAVEYAKVSIVSFVESESEGASTGDCWTAETDHPIADDYKADYDVCVSDSELGLYDVTATVYRHENKSDATSFEFSVVEGGI